MIKIVFSNERRKGVKPNDKFIELDYKKFDLIDYQGVIWFEGGNIKLIEYCEGNDD